jgi:hypothetical protein
MYCIEAPMVAPVMNVLTVADFVVEVVAVVAAFLPS